MTEDLNTIARRIVCAPLPEAKDWQNYYESLIQLASRLLKVEKHHEFFFAGKHVQIINWYIINFNATPMRSFSI